MFGEIALAEVFVLGPQLLGDLAHRRPRQKPLAGRVEGQACYIDIDTGAGSEARQGRLADYPSLKCHFSHNLAGRQVQPALALQDLKIIQLRPVYVSPPPLWLNCPINCGANFTVKFGRHLAASCRTASYQVWTELSLRTRKEEMWGLTATPSIGLGSGAGLVMRIDFDALAGSLSPDADRAMVERVVDAIAGPLSVQRDRHLLLPVNEGDISERVAVVALGLADGDSPARLPSKSRSSLSGFGTSTTNGCQLSEQPFSWCDNVAIFTILSPDEFADADREPSNSGGTAVTVRTSIASLMVFICASTSAPCNPSPRCAALGVGSL